MKTALLRKKPKQTRSKLMVDNILEASIRVLKQHPYHQFTTNRVAEVACYFRYSVGGELVVGMLFQNANRCFKDIVDHQL